MTSRAARRGAKRRKRTRAARNRPQTWIAEDLPRPLRLIVESSERLAGFAATAESPAAASSAALASVRAGVDSVLEMMSGYDSLDILEGIVLTNLFADPERYKETHHEGSAAVVELVALIAGCKSPIAKAGVPGEFDLYQQPDIDGIQRAAIDIVDAGAMWQLFRAADSTEPVAGIGLTLSIREAHVRNSSYPHMVRDTLDELFGDAAVVTDCKAALSVTPREIFSVLDALPTVRGSNWQSRFDTLRELDERMEGWQKDGSPADAETQAESGLTQVWGRPSEAAVVDVQQIASDTGLNADVVASVLDLFTCDVTAQTAQPLAERFLSGDNPLRLRPILLHPSGRRVVVHDALLVHAARERIEEGLKAAGLSARYFEWRAACLEKAALDHLKVLFPTGDLRGSFEYFVPDPDKPLEQIPSQFTKLVESDGLLTVDDVAIVLEAKSGALSDKARAGNRARLRSDLANLVTSAAEQAARVRTRILTDRELRLRDGTTIDLRGVREIYTLAVTLEDLAGIATVTDDLVQAGLLPSDFLPWVVSIHDLRIIGELVDRPAEMLLYLRRRTLPELTKTFLATDELDLFLHMFNAGLYVVPDPDVLEQELPMFPVQVSQRRRFQKQATQFLTSRTVPLDDWYFFQTGERTTPASKPSMRVPEELKILVDEITSAADPGWLSTTTALISGDLATCRKYAAFGAELVRATLIDGSPHMMTSINGDRGQSLVILVWLSSPGGLSAEQTRKFDEHYYEYLAAKKHQVQAPRAALLIFDSTGAFARLLFDNRVPGPDVALDAKVASLGLRAPADMNANVAVRSLKGKQQKRSRSKKARSNTRRKSRKGKR